MARARQPTFYNITRYPDVGCYDQDFDEPRVPAASEIFTTCGRRAAHPRHTPGSSDSTRESTALSNKACSKPESFGFPIGLQPTIWMMKDG